MSAFADEIHRQLKDSSAKAIITLASSWETAAESRRLLNKDLPILVIRTEVPSFTQIVKAGVQFVLF